MYLHHCYLLHHIYIVIIYIYNIFYFPGFQLFIAVSSLWRLPYGISILQNWEPWLPGLCLVSHPDNWSRKGQAAGHDSDWRWGWYFLNFFDGILASNLGNWWDFHGFSMIFSSISHEDAEVWEWYGHAPKPSSYLCSLGIEPANVGANQRQMEKHGDIKAVRRWGNAFSKYTVQSPSLRQCHAIGYISIT